MPAKPVKTKSKNKREHQSQGIFVAFLSPRGDGIHSLKFLGTLVSSRLTRSASIATVAKKVWQHLHFLRLREKNRAKQSWPFFFFFSSANRATACLHQRFCNTREGRSREHSAGDLWLCSSLPGGKGMRNELHLRFEDLSGWFLS